MRTPSPRQTVRYLEDACGRMRRRHGAVTQPAIPRDVKGRQSRQPRHGRDALQADLLDERAIRERREIEAVRAGTRPKLVHKSVRENLRLPRDERPRPDRGDQGKSLAAQRRKIRASVARRTEKTLLSDLPGRPGVTR